MGRQVSTTLAITILLQLASQVMSQTVSVSTDENVFLCKKEEDCSAYFQGTAKQGEWYVLYKKTHILFYFSWSHSLTLPTHSLLHLHFYSHLHSSFLT